MHNTTKTHLNIWLIQLGESLPIKDGISRMRTAILAEKLVERGHSVLWWASAFDHLRKEWVFLEDTECVLAKGIKIKAIKGIGYRNNFSLRRYFDYRIIAKKFKKSATKMIQPDIIIASLPSHLLAYEASKFAKRNDIPILVDIRDPWPDIFLNYVPSGLKIIVRTLLKHDFFVTKETMKTADGILSMMNVLLEWGLKYAGRGKTWKDKVFYLGYKNDLKTVDGPGRLENEINKLNNKFVVSFIGTFSNYHNPSILLDCAEKLSKEEISFVLAGEGKSLDELKNRALHMTNVIFTGWLSQDEIRILLKHSHVGVCPTTKIANFFPNKAFMYLSKGIPVISAFQGDLKDLIEKRGIGFYYPPNDADALCNIIQRLHQDKALYMKISGSAKDIFLSDFQADVIYDKYVRHIENVQNCFVSIVDKDSK